MKVLVTGSAGFIGSALSIKLLDRGDCVVGVDNHNDYYSPSLKEARLARHIEHKNYSHIRMDIEDVGLVGELFAEHNFDSVVNLAAQAGVRYSIENPLTYINTNMLGFGSILEGCRHNNVKHLVYFRGTGIVCLALCFCRPASSSSDVKRYSMYWRSCSVPSGKPPSTAPRVPFLRMRDLVI